jgi:hypothetical protein
LYILILIWSLPLQSVNVTIRLYSVSVTAGKTFWISKYFDSFCNHYMSVLLHLSQISAPRLWFWIL